MPTAAEPAAGLSYEELKLIIEENCEPFLTVEQTRRFIKAASILRMREPAEMELAGGDRINKRDLLDMIKRADAVLPTLEIAAGATRATVIVPPDCLR